MSEQSNLLFGCVSSKTETPITEQYSRPSTFLRLGEGAVTLMAPGQKAVDMPADGCWAVFEVQRSRKNLGIIKRWGWCTGVERADTDNPEFQVDWQREFAAQSVGGGVTRNGRSK